MSIQPDKIQNLIAIWDKNVNGTELSSVPLDPVITEKSVTEQLCLLCQGEPYAFGSEHVTRFIATIFARGGSTSPNVNHLLILATNGESIVAALLAQRIFADIEIEYLIVSPQTRHQKIGTRLLASLEQESGKRGVSRIILEVGVENTAAIKLYLGAGFKQISQRKNYYRGKEDALILEKTLTTPHEESAVPAMKSPES